MKKKDIEQFKRYAAMYWGQRVLKFGKKAPATQLVNSSMMDYITEDFMLELRPLSSMTEEECLEVCKLASPTAWGDYRFKKWTAKPDPKNSDSWKAYDVTNENSPYSFVVDLIDGDITLWDEGDYENTLVNQNYRFWYLSKHFDLFGLIESGQAIEKK